MAARKVESGVARRTKRGKPRIARGFWSWLLYRKGVQRPASRLCLDPEQALITLSVFVPLMVIYMKQPLKLDYLRAALCMLGAVYFVFRTG